MAKKETPVDFVNGIIFPIVLLLVLIAAALWAISQISTAFTFSLLGMGSGMLLLAIGIIIIVYYRLK